MLVNPEGETKHHKKWLKYLQIVFPKVVRRIRANPEYPETAGKKGKALIGSSQESMLQVHLEVAPQQ
jgi:hypothetical protein